MVEENKTIECTMWIHLDSLIEITDNLSTLERESNLSGLDLKNELAFLRKSIVA